ncbi:uncharacterized protein BX663DRAFT_426629 [Cokeromyces recurvatus]|uniref:uncharacterized protein n=1 Tax=Cokeromyces recurvatus TaxID=90255 RepID=UPI00221F6733|nr:uncharacterized protein BX663DRAFT_426629 [Cokeromyces recurvatus]KAI7907106.1 hypothetical protein BX663DRAFT_426629 [Cokeromyces recurvatus]
MLDIQKDSSVWTSSSSSSSSSFSSVELDDRSIPTELLQSLRQHSIFQRTNNESFIEKIACCMHLRTYGPRDIIIVEGEPAKAMFFLLRGSVDVCSADFERIYATLPKGSCFGEIGILYSMPRTATVIASTKCIVASLTAEEVKTILPQYPKVEKMLRFEAEERLTLLKKSKNLNETKKISYKPFTERNVEDLTSAHNLLKKIPYFQSCPEEFLHYVSLKVEPRHYAPNDLILKKGDIGKELFFILSGTVEITNMDTVLSDSLTPIEHLSTGDYFGDIAVLLETPRTANVRAVTPIELYVLKKSDFMDVLNRFPDLQAHFKAMAESSLNNLRLKVTNFIIIIIIATPVIPTGTPDECLSFTNAPVITPDSVCSTTSDQDPTLLPPSTTNMLKMTETRKRRASVAIWSDPNLVALANRNLKSVAVKGSKLKEEEAKKSIKAPTSSLIFSGDGRIASLNEEILSLIVNNLDFYSIIQLSAVSRKFHEFVLHNDKIMHIVDLSHLNKRVTDNTIASIVKITGVRARKLNLSQCFYITDEGFKALVDYMPHVESMDLNSCWLLTDKSLAYLTVACPHLTVLDLSNCRKMSDIGLFKLLDEKVSRNYPQLTHLSLSYCKKLSDMSMGYLAEFCSETLTSLNIQRCTRITDQGFLKWSNTQFPSLRNLNLTDCSFLTDQAISHLILAAPHLKNLSLSFCCALSDSAIEGLNSLSELEHLDASFCGAAVSDISIKALLSSNKLRDTIQSLNLRGCVRITDKCVKSILEWSHLETLNISQCPGISLNTKQFVKESGSIHNLVA